MDTETRLNKIEEELELLKSFTTIPFDVESAFRARLNINDLARIIVSTKSATSENQSVNESGVSSYSVLKAPDAFLQVQVSGSTYYIPIFT